MQVVAAPQTPPHLFFLGLRAPVGGQGPAAERVGVMVLKQTVQMDGTVGGGRDILLKDEPYPGPSASGPFNLESDLVPAKPSLDAVAVWRQIDDGTLFGTLEIDRGNGFGVVHYFNFGWLSRTVNPRKDLAGIHLDAFQPQGTNLPERFENDFFNGGPVPGEAPLGDANVVRFIPNGGAARSVRIPPAPTLAFTQDGRPLSPPVAISLVVDTVVFDLAGTEFLLTWRGVFLWESRLELATLEVS